MPCTQLCSDASDEITALILLELLIDSLSLLLVRDRESDITSFSMDLGHLEENIACLLAIRPIRLLGKFHHALKILERRVVVPLFRVDSSHDLEYLTIARIVNSLQLLIHLQGFLEQTDCIPVVTGLQVTLAKFVENVGVIVASLSHSLEKFSINLQSARQVLKCLLMSLQGEVCFSKLSVRDHQQEDTLVVDSDQYFAE